MQNSCASLKRLFARSTRNLITSRPGSGRKNNGVETRRMLLPHSWWSLARTSYRALEFSEDDRYADEMKIHNLTTSECMTAYGTSFLSEYRNVVAITSARGNQTSNTMIWSETVRLNSQHVSYGQVLYEWICRDAQEEWKQYVWKCNVAAASQNASNWTIHYHQIDYCLAQATQRRCKLQFSIQILATVIVMNVCKFICMFLKLWRQRAATLVTIGDAMSSFLDQPDSLTKNRCLMGRLDLNRGPLHWKTFSKDGTTTRRPNTDPERVTFRAPLRRRWFVAASIRRWCLTICLIALSVASKLLHTGALNLKNKTSASIFKTGFALFCYRSEYAASSHELSLSNIQWSIYLHKEIVAGHDSTWPAAPNLLLAASISIRRATSGLINTTDYKGESSAKDFSQVGYSCLPILLAILFGTAMLIAALGCGLRRFPSYIPVAGSCSVALAAAAHRPKDDVDAAFLPMQWSEVRSEGTDEVGHCCFMSQERESRITTALTINERPSFGPDCNDQYTIQTATCLLVALPISEPRVDLPTLACPTYPRAIYIQELFPFEYKYTQYNSKI
ncbi:hypothetical protein KC349_g318 [Hortaea werneckii]|nr:hypothetical protein KC349_g318 [Hortaea werneckii]